MNLASGKTCTVGDCSTIAYRRGYCSKHYQRLRKHGDPLKVLPAAGGSHVLSNHPNWSGDNASYQAIHKRLRRVRGPASKQLCIDCDSQAKSWSYNHLDKNVKTEIRNNKTYVYSLELSNYDPRCTGCHTKHDKVGMG